MRLRLLALSLATACVPGIALAQGSATPDQPEPTLVAQNQMGQFVVYFALGESTLDAEGQATVAAAAQEFQRSGSAAISVRGHTDASGSSAFNQALSERREQAVADALIAQGVPASAITGEALGETQLAVPTEDGVREEANRRVEITVQQPPPPPEPAPAPAPVAEAPPPPPEPEQPKRGLLSIGPFYGFVLDDKNGETSHLAGLNLSLDYAVMPWLGVGVEQAGFYNFASDNEGFGGRSAASLNFLAGGEQFAPYAGGNIGYLYGAGLDDDAFAGPEIGVVAGPINAKVAYDIPFNRDFDEGIIAATIGAGFRF